MVIEPSLCRAGLQTDLRIFQQQDSQKIIETLLSKNQVISESTPFTNAILDFENTACNIVKLI